MSLQNPTVSSNLRQSRWLLPPHLILLCCMLLPHVSSSQHRNYFSRHPTPHTFLFPSPSAAKLPTDFNITTTVTHAHTPQPQPWMRLQRNTMSSCWALVSDVTPSSFICPASSLVGLWGPRLLDRASWLTGRPHRLLFLGLTECVLSG
ncbi:hypothetical protein CaCOL14_007826 [Colletotrichum acutatum]